MVAGNLRDAGQVLAQVGPQHRADARARRPRRPAARSSLARLGGREADEPLGALDHAVAQTTTRARGSNRSSRRASISVIARPSGRAGRAGPRGRRAAGAAGGRGGRRGGCACETGARRSSLWQTHVRFRRQPAQRPRASGSPAGARAGPPRRRRARRSACRRPGRAAAPAGRRARGGRAGSRSRAGGAAARGAGARRRARARGAAPRRAPCRPRWTSARARGTSRTAPSACAASGMPTCSTACAARPATGSACGSALPMSSEARMTMRRAMKRGSSPPSSITAR